MPCRWIYSQRNTNNWQLARALVTQVILIISDSERPNAAEKQSSKKQKRREKEKLDKIYVQKILYVQPLGPDLHKVKRKPRAHTHIAHRTAVTFHTHFVAFNYIYCDMMTERHAIRFGFLQSLANIENGRTPNTENMMVNCSESIIINTRRMGRRQKTSISDKFHDNYRLNRSRFDLIHSKSCNSICRSPIAGDNIIWRSTFNRISEFIRFYPFFDGSTAKCE